MTSYLSSTSHLLYRFVERYWGLVLAVGALSYFSFHLIHGDRGLKAMVEMQAKLADTRQHHEQQLARRTALERQVELLKRDGSDPDMIEEQLRLLGYVGERDIIVLERPGPAR